MKNGKLNTTDIMVLFGKSYITVWNWMMGHTAKVAKIPCHSRARGIQRKGIYFNKAEALKWAVANKIKLAATGELPVVSREHVKLF